MKTSLLQKLTAALAICFGTWPAFANDSEARVLASLLAQSQKIMVKPTNPASTLESSRLNTLLAKVLLKTHLNLTPKLDCGKDVDNSMSCAMLLSVETAKDSSSDKPKDEDTMIYLLFFSYRESKGGIKIIDNTIRYRIEQ